MITSIVSFILIFCIIVVAHELGHFLMARKNGIHVSEFFVGIGPTLFSFHQGGTKFSLRLFPLGGACVFQEEYEPEEEDGKAAEPSEGSFLKASVTARFSAILGGPLFNFIVAYIIGLFIVANTGTDLPVIEAISPGGQAEAAGLMVGDTITKINNEKIHLYRQIYFISYTSQGETLQVTYERDGVENSVAITPAYSEEAGRYLLGVNGYGRYVKCDPLQIFKCAFYEVEYGVTTTLKTLSMLVQGRLTKNDVSGPVGIAMVVGETYEIAKPYGISVVVLSMLNIAMILSVNLGIMNLLPIPALDGGRLVFLLIEMIRGKPLPPEKEGLVHMIGMAALLVLTVFVLFNDITKFF